MYKKEYGFVSGHRLYDEEADTMLLVVELAVMHVVLSNLDIMELVFTVTLGFHFKLGIY